MSTKKNIEIKELKKELTILSRAVTVSIQSFDEPHLPDKNAALVIRQLDAEQYDRHKFNF